MLKNISKLNNLIKNMQNNVQYNIEYYKRIVEKINDINLESLNNNELKEMSSSFKNRIYKGEKVDNILVDAYALVCEVCSRVLKMRPFDVQVIAAIAMHEGKIVEMKTGEGKTLSAVMPAYLNALSGKGVHVLTFNDYLAHRDANWMGPVYEFLGLNVGYVNEDMTMEKRKQAYLCDITYVTAKEAGFDYLRDFLCDEKEKLVHRQFNYAIIDEADSILIDEARIPLVIAGEITKEEKNIQYLSKIVKNLKENIDYEIDQYGSNITLTEDGLLHVEEILKCDNLYEDKNLELLSRVNSALYAEFLIKKDKDYIVRCGKVELIDEFTGRIADNRHLPDNLHIAVEAKEGLISKSKGNIMGSIALQYFLSLYKKLSGMTGTASNVALELRENYLLDVVVIPTNKPCMRKDNETMIFTHKEAKYKKIISDISEIHQKGQPILIGTGSVEESEWLSNELNVIGIKCEVLNAKNDEMEASVISKAGEFGAVTVSTNMAGRGVDIKLGGENEEDKERVVKSGGLFVIGTNLHESIRIDNQLRGRSGRQGDVGESRFYVSLEDDLIKRYDIKKMIRDKHYPKKQEEPVESEIIRREFERGQRIVEGYNYEIRKQLWKYSYITEQQRRIIHTKRENILLDKENLKFLSNECSDRYISLCEKYGKNVLEKVEKKLTLFFINKCWAEYLEYISYIRESIHLVVIGKKNPLDEFNRISIESFDEMLEDIENEIVNTFNEVEIDENGIKDSNEILKSPSSTWVYLIDDSLDQFSNLPRLINATKTAIVGTLFSIQSVYKNIYKKLMS